VARGFLLLLLRGGGFFNLVGGRLCEEPAGEIAVRVKASSVTIQSSGFGRKE